MSNSISIRQFLNNYKNGQYDSTDRETQCDAGWFDWLCDDSRLHDKTVKLVKYLKSIVKSKKINIDKMYVFFKNNCPGDGKLYDDFRICDIETGDVVYTITPHCGHTQMKGESTVWGRENKFDGALVTGTWKDVCKFFGVDAPTKKAAPDTVKKPSAKLLGADSNIFNLIGIASESLRGSKMEDKAKEMWDRVKTQAKSFDEALSIILEYVEAV